MAGTMLSPLVLLVSSSSSDSSSTAGDVVSNISWPPLPLGGILCAAEGRCVPKLAGSPVPLYAFLNFASCACLFFSFACRILYFSSCSFFLVSGSFLLLACLPCVVPAEAGAGLFEVPFPLFFLAIVQFTSMIAMLFFIPR